MFCFSFQELIHAACLSASCPYRCTMLSSGVPTCASDSMTGSYYDRQKKKSGTQVLWQNLLPSRYRILYKIFGIAMDNLKSCLQQQNVQTRQYVVANTGPGLIILSLYVRVKKNLSYRFFLRQSPSEDLKFKGILKYDSKSKLVPKK